MSLNDYKFLINLIILISGLGVGNCCYLLLHVSSSELNHETYDSLMIDYALFLLIISLIVAFEIPY